MKYPGIISAGILLAVIECAAWAQIYQTEDEQGNPVFSDEPVDGSSSVIDLTKTNIADAPASEPEATATPAAAAESERLPKADDRPASQDPNAGIWEERVQRQEEFDRMKSSSTPSETLDADAPREVMDAEPPREVMDAEPPREVMDAEPRREVMDAEPRR